MVTTPKSRPAGPRRSDVNKLTHHPANVRLDPITRIDKGKKKVTNHVNPDDHRRRSEGDIANLSECLPRVG